MKLAAPIRTNSFVSSCLEHYDLGVVAVEGELPGGMFSRPVVIQSDRGPFVIRRHTFRDSLDSFKFQADTIQFAHDSGVPCARVVPTRRGESSLSIDGHSGVFAVHDFVDGANDDWAAWRRRKDNQDGFLVQLGRCVAKLHNSLKSARPGGDPALPISLPPIQFAFMSEAEQAWRRSFETLRRADEIACTQTREKLLALEHQLKGHWNRLCDSLILRNIDAVPRQIVHGDISAVNIVIDGAGRMSFIDWDCVHVGHRLYDALGDVLNRPPSDEPRQNRFRRDHVEDYLEGYSEATDEPLTSRERELVPTFCLARQLEDVRQRLYVLPELARKFDAMYARLIQMRLDMMDQIDL